MCSLTRMRAQDKFCDPTVYSMYIEHYSVGSFGDKCLRIFILFLN